MTLHPEALGWTLLHFCWQATAIALGYGAIDMALRNAGSRARHGLAVAALLAMVLTAAATLFHELAMARLGTSYMAAIGAGDALPVDAIGGAWRRTEGQLGIAALLPWLDLMWLAGVLCLTLRALGGYHVLRRFVRATDPDVPEQLTALVLGLCARLGITRPVTLRLSRHACGPFVVGVVRSVIIVPASALTALTPAQLEAVLAHELAHVRRADFLWNILQTIVETLFFFHPAVWWIGRRLRAERELCCDDMALAACGDPVTYATALVALERVRPPHRPAYRIAPALDGHGSGTSLRARITRILDGEPHRPRRFAPILAVGAGLVSLLLVSPSPYARAADGISPHLSGPYRATAPSHRPTVSMTFGAQTTVSMADRSAAGPAPRASAPATEAAPAPTTAPEAEDYAGAMHNAGYADDDRYLPAMQQDGVPPDYVRSLAGFDLGMAQARQIRTLWTRGVRAADIRALQAAGAEPADWRDMVGFSLYGVTPAFVAAMRAAGFDHIDPGKLIMLGKLGVTPDYARAAKQADPSLDTWHLIHQRLVETGRWHPFSWRGLG